MHVAHASSTRVPFLFNISNRLAFAMGSEHLVFIQPKHFLSFKSKLFVSVGPYVFHCASNELSKAQCPLAIRSTASATDSASTNAMRLSSALGVSTESPAYGSGEATPLFERQLLATVGPSFTSQHMKDAVSVKDKPLFQNYKIGSQWHACLAQK